MNRPMEPRKPVEPNKTYLKLIEKINIETDSSFEQLLKRIDNYKDYSRMFFDITTKEDCEMYDNRRGVCYLFIYEEVEDERYDKFLKSYESEMKRYEKEMTKYGKELKKYEEYWNNKKEKEQKKLYEALKKKYENQ